MNIKLNYPYIQNRSKVINQRKIAKYIKSKYIPRLKVINKKHPFISHNTSDMLDDWKSYSKKYPYFLKFDIKKYYVNIDHEILIKTLLEIYKSMYNRPAPKKLENDVLNKYLKNFFQSTAYNDMSLPLGSSLSYVLGYIYLIKLDLVIKTPYIKYMDDYLVFFKKRVDIDKFVYDVLMPTLNSMKLNIQNDKLLSGKFSNTRMDFLGFSYYLGMFSCDDKRIDDFRSKIKALTSLRNQDLFEIVLKRINYKIVGFGHYYKYAMVKTTYIVLDKYIRSRIRRYYKRICSYNNIRVSNIVLCNDELSNLGLKSLTSIYINYQKSK